MIQAATGEQQRQLLDRADGRANFVVGFHLGGISGRVTIQSWPSGYAARYIRCTQAQLLKNILIAVERRIEELTR